MSIRLDNYSFNRAETAFSVLTLSGGVLAKRHWEAAKTSETGTLGHRIIAVAEAVPVLGGIIALIEMVVARVFTPKTQNKILGDLWVDNPQKYVDGDSRYSHSNSNVPIFTKGNHKFHWQDNRICVHLDQLTDDELKTLKIKVRDENSHYYYGRREFYFNFSTFFNQAKVSLKNLSAKLEQLIPASGSEPALKAVRQGLGQNYQELYDTYFSTYHSFNLADKTSSTNQASSNQLQPSSFVSWYGNDTFANRDVRYTFGSDNAANAESLEEEKSDTDSNAVLVHSSVLKTRAPEYFMTLFSGNFAESQTRVVTCNPSERKIYEQFFLFLYKNEIGQITNKEARELYRMGDMYGVEDLKTKVYAQAKQQDIEDGHPNHLVLPKQFNADLEKISSISEMKNQHETEAAKVAQLYNLCLKQYLPQAILHGK